MISQYCVKLPICLVKLRKHGTSSRTRSKSWLQMRFAREQSLSEHVAALNEQAEEQAAAGEWEAVSPLLSKRDALFERN